eukprot:2301129-Pyramimonas_sp.AAC.1
MLTNDSADGTPPANGPDRSTLSERCPTASPQAQEGSTSVGDRWRGFPVCPAAHLRLQAFPP